MGIVSQIIVAVDGDNNKWKYHSRDRNVDGQRTLGKQKHTWKKLAFANSTHLYIIALPQPPRIIRMYGGKNLFSSHFSVGNNFVAKAAQATNTLL